MIYPTIQDLTKGNYNRYELAIATAKGARRITDEYVRQRSAAESAAGNGKDNDKPLANMIDKKLKDGEFVITEEEEIAALELTEAEEAEKTEEAEEPAKEVTEE